MKNDKNTCMDSTKDIAINSAERAAKEHLTTIPYFTENEIDVKWEIRTILSILHTIISILLLILR